MRLVRVRMVPSHSRGAYYGTTPVSFPGRQIPTLCHVPQRLTQTHQAFNQQTLSDALPERAVEAVPVPEPNQTETLSGRKD